MGWKLPPGVLDHVIPLDRTALATTDSGLHSLLPFGPNPRRARQGHSRSAFIENNLGNGAKVISFPRVGGLHHRYGWQQAA